MCGTLTSSFLVNRISDSAGSAWALTETATIREQQGQEREDIGHALNVGI
jgi:hypothetical protein